MKNNAELVKHLEARVLKTPNIISAFEAIDRKDFVPEEFVGEAYEDYPLSIAGGQTISQPYTVAFMLELLQPQKGEKILDVGSGSGWTTALLAHIAGKKGKVIGMEIVPELVSFGSKNLAKYNFSHAEIRQAKEDVFGTPEDAPFDRILVSAAPDKLPQDLIDQLAPSGTMVIPVRNTMFKVTKTKSGEIEKEEHGGFAFVPLME